MSEKQGITFIEPESLKKVCFATDKVTSFIGSSPLTLSTAAEKYRKAISLDKTDAAPVRTLSSALFELGKYEECISTIQQALELEKDEKKRRDIGVRRMKCLFYLRQWDQIVDGSEATDEERELIQAARKYSERMQTNKVGWEEVIELPRGRPQAGTSVEKQLSGAMIGGSWS